MVRTGHLPLVLSATLAFGLSGSLAAQESPSTPPAIVLKIKQVPPPVAPGPFSVTAPNRPIDQLLTFRDPDQMTGKDRLLAANAQSSIVEHAGLNGFALEEGTWTYQQVVCSALPNHLFLRYKRNNGTGDVTVFSASIPRGSEGRVRVIPILRRSYSLFSPAPINAITISVFNHIRTEEPETQSGQEWLGNALCYAALAGAHPKLALPEDEPTEQKPVPELGAILTAQTSGGEVITFADEAARPKAMKWTMTFNRSGKLVKATHAPAVMLTEKPVPPVTVVNSTSTVPTDTQD